MKHSVVIVGGGSAGITVAARLRNERPNLDIAIIEPSVTHYYQPLWTLVGAGVFTVEDTARPEADYVPLGVHWIRDRVKAFDPDNNQVTTAEGHTVRYEQLVVAAGIQLDWNKIDGLDGHVGDEGIGSNYSADTVDYTWKYMQAFEGGNALFTFPMGPIKCAGAPQKIMYLAEEHFRKKGIRGKTNVHYMSATASIFGVQKYRDALEKVVARKEIETTFSTHLTAIRPKSKEAVFAHNETGEETVMNYDFIHVVPPQSAPDFIKRSPLANEAGWVDVDMYSTQHTVYPNVFSLGDCSSLPNSKTGAAVRKQAPVVVENLLHFREGLKLNAAYDGYASCPLVTGVGKLILAEFKYGGVVDETFPFNQAKERYSMYALKAYGLPELYWNGMLRGRA